MPYDIELSILVSLLALNCSPRSDALKEYGSGIHGSQGVNKGEPIGKPRFGGNARVMWERPAAPVLHAILSPDGKRLPVLGSSRENVCLFER